jgi:hypothetical protein
MAKDPFSAFKKKLPSPVVHTKIPGAFAMKGWPGDFDLETATPSELMKHGGFGGGRNPRTILG